MRTVIESLRSGTARYDLLTTTAASEGARSPEALVALEQAIASGV